MMADAELNALESVAKAATPGPWIVKPSPDVPGRCNGIAVASGWPEIVQTDCGMYPPEIADARHIALANPKTVLVLIAELRMARAIVRDLAQLDPATDVRYEVDDGDGHMDEMARHGPCFFCEHHADAKLSSDGRTTLIHSPRCLRQRAIEATKP